MSEACDMYWGKREVPAGFLWGSANERDRLAKQRKGSLGKTTKGIAWQNNERDGLAKQRKGSLGKTTKGIARQNNERDRLAKQRKGSLGKTYPQTEGNIKMCVKKRTRRIMGCGLKWTGLQ